MTTGGSKIDDSVDLDKRQLSRVEESLIDRSVELTRHSKSSVDRDSGLGTELRSLSQTQKNSKGGKETQIEKIQNELNKFRGISIRTADARSPSNGDTMTGVISGSSEVHKNDNVAI